MQAQLALHKYWIRLSNAQLNIDGTCSISDRLFMLDVSHVLHLVAVCVQPIRLSRVCSTHYVKAAPSFNADVQPICRCNMLPQDMQPKL